MTYKTFLLWFLASMYQGKGRYGVEFDFCTKVYFRCCNYVSGFGFIRPRFYSYCYNYVYGFNLYGTNNDRVNYSYVALGNRCCGTVFGMMNSF